MKEPDWKDYIAVLQGIPFVERVGVERSTTGRRSEPGHSDGIIVVVAGGKKHRLIVEEKRGRQFARPVLEAYVASMTSKEKLGRVLLVDFISPEHAGILERSRINFVDRAGNHRLQIGQAFHAYSFGHRATTQTRHARALGLPGYKLLFAILAKPELLATPNVRAVAAEAGVGKSTVSESLRRLIAEGLLVRAQSGLRIVRPEKVLDRWLHGYAELLRPRLRLGTFEFEGQPGNLRSRLRSIAEREGTPPEATPRWGWGGEYAANQLTQHLRSDELLIHVEDSGTFLTKRIPLIPSRNGRLRLMGAPGPLAFLRWGEETVHPLLVYAELMSDGNERAREAAHIIRNRHLPWLSGPS